jgi:hypothetical protein
MSRKHLRRLDRGLAAAGGQVSPTSGLLGAPGVECKDAQVSGERRTTADEARGVGDQIGVDWDRFDLEQFRAGMDVEYEHGSHDPQTDVTGDDLVTTGKIALAHMKEFPDYFDRLRRMEQEAEQDWATSGTGDLS